MTIKLLRLRPLVVVGLLAISAIALLGARASATSPVSAAAPTHAFAWQPVPIDEQTATFEALRAPAATATSIPAAIREKIATGEQAQTFGVSLGALRAVRPGIHAFYVTATPKGLCMFLPDGGSVCNNNIAALRRNGLSFSVVPAPPQRVSQGMDTVGVGTITTYGIAPDGVTAIEGETSTGQVVPAHMTAGAYVIDTDHPVVRMSFHSADTTWETVPGGGSN